MISDTLSDAIADIRVYLDDEVMGRAYEGEMRTRIEALVTEMEAIRRILDTPPNFDGPRQRPSEAWYDHVIAPHARLIAKNLSDDLGVDVEYSSEPIIPDDPIQ